MIIIIFSPLRAGHCLVAPAVGKYVKTRGSQDASFNPLVGVHVDSP